MSAELTIAIAQTNPTVGDIPGNLARIRAARADAAAAGADLVVYSELVVVGYPPEDLVLKQAFQEEARRAVEELAGDTADGGPALIVGAPWVDRGKLYNAMLLLQGGRIVDRALQARPAELRRVRREAGVRCGTGARADGVPAAGAASSCASAAWCARTCGPATWPRASRNPAPRS